jgi:TolB-like protein
VARPAIPVRREPVATARGGASVTESSRAVFLSYASEDAGAAKCICDALRTAGLEVWFDQSELRGGDAWDQSIRKRIKTCALFLPVISRNTHDRIEGYFRLEWKLAVDRSHLIAADQAFLLPVVIDDTRDDDERVPERFREVQWTRLPGGVTPAAFVERVRRLLSGEPAQGSTGTPSAAARPPAVRSTRKSILALWRSKAALLATIAVLVAAFGYLVANRLVLSKRGAEVGAAPAPAAQNAPAPAFTPPPHSIAVLPFVNLSGDKEQEYFSDGLTEELLNSLSRINELQVAARTSSFSFQGEHPDIATVAHKLNVGAVLEGSVRRSANTVRITAQLVNGVSGFHVWSQTYDRSIGDVLAIQTEIANAVASALKVTLLNELAAKVELGGTRNPAAFDAYLRGLKIYNTVRDYRGEEPAIAAFTEAIKLDPGYALAFANRSIAQESYAGRLPQGGGSDEIYRRAQADAQRAIDLAPTLADGHLALAYVYQSGFLDFRRASSEYERALEFAPGYARVVRNYGSFAVMMGRTDAGIAAGRRAVALDPLNPKSHGALADMLSSARQYRAAIAALQEAINLSPEQEPLYAAGVAFNYYALGDLESAQVSCERASNFGFRRECLAIIYEKLGRHADAEAVLADIHATMGDVAAYQYAQIAAQWGNHAQALDWLNTAVRLRDGGLSELKVDWQLDPIRNDPRFQAIERALKFPPP